MGWRFINSGPQPGLINMAIDEALYAGVEEGVSPPTLRLYTWSTPCVSLGYFQKAEAELDLEKLEAAGLPWVRRITGGRAVMHHNELAYSVAAGSKQAPWCATREKSYRAISIALVEALKSGFFKPQLVRSETPFHPRAAVASPCFSTPAKSEIEWEGKKMVGSAQRRGRKAFLQHGSILLGPEHLELVEYLNVTDKHRLSFAASLERTSTSLSEAVNSRVSPDAVAENFDKKMGAALGVDFYSGGLSGWERAKVESILQMRQANAFARSDF